MIIFLDVHVIQLSFAHVHTFSPHLIQKHLITFGHRFELQWSVEHDETLIGKFLRPNDGRQSVLGLCRVKETRDLRAIEFSSIIDRD